ncbi:MAG: GNAT family N-acetyltransferase [Pseudomonadota bacterium]
MCSSDPTIYRETVTETDMEAVRTVVDSSGFFSAEEISTAMEQVHERLAGGPASDYHFLFAERAGRVIGYTCFGPIAGTAAGFDLYWIAVHNEFRGYGAGKELLERSEKIICRMGGRRIYIETSSRDQYRPTRTFYESCGYQDEAHIADFYSPGDAKIIYVKVMQTP